MKKIFLSVLCMLGFTFFMQAQDLITTKDGSDILAKILEVTQSEIKYKKINNLDGPTFTIDKSDILIVRYENGENEVFNTSTTRTSNKHRNTTENVVEGMRYREYSKLYDTTDYVPMPGDPYSRGWAGVCSFLIPGLGEGIDGEWGYAISTLLCNVAMGYGAYIGILNDNAAIYYSMLGCRVILNILSVYNAIHIAKVKNMYFQDIKSQRASLDFKVEPFFAYAPVDIIKSLQPTAGLSLKLSF